jgi:hypothetical protein
VNVTERSKADLERIAMDAIRDFVNRPEADGIHQALLDAYDEQAVEIARLREAWIAECGNLEMAEAKVQEQAGALGRAKADAWAEGYSTGVEDERAKALELMGYWDPPNRANPYRDALAGERPNR